MSTVDLPIFPDLKRLVDAENARRIRHTIIDVPYKLCARMPTLMFPDHRVVHLSEIGEPYKAGHIQDWKEAWSRAIGDVPSGIPEDFSTRDIADLAEEARANACRIWRESIIDYGIRAIMATSDEDAVAGRWHDSVKDVIGDRR